MVVWDFEEGFCTMKRGWSANVKILFRSLKSFSGIQEYVVVHVLYGGQTPR